MGGGQHVAGCSACASLCDREADCLSYECSPTELRCNLNAAADPTPGRPNWEDYVFCSVSVPTTDCPFGYTASSQDVIDGAQNVNNNNVVDLASCSQLCDSGAACLMFEFNANAERCKISSGALGGSQQLSGWQSCIKSG